MLRREMAPRLVAISGPLKGTTFALSQDEMSIGRDLSNSVSLIDPSVSRRHCLITQKPETKEFALLDLESFNRTFVNGVPVREKLLVHGDEIALGDTRFLFLTHEESTKVIAAFQDDEVITRSTIRLEREHAFYLRPDVLVAEAAVDSRVSSERNALLKISTAMNSTRSLADLQGRLLELLLEVMPAEREAILLADKAGEFVSVFGWSRNNGADDSIRVSKRVSRQVFTEVVALLSNDVFENKNIGDTPSLVQSGVRSLMCVPLVACHEPLGVIYLDTASPIVNFDQGHLQLLTAIAGMAALAFESALHIESLEGENQRLQEELSFQHKMIGESQPMCEVYKLLAKVAPVSSTVLILGESGTGKELAAHALHLNSTRATKPFIAINCATLTEGLLESELFGHEKGAFTGAISRKLGKLEVADGGTLFLDELGELSPAIQAKLLRVLQARELERLGGTLPIKVDVRVIAATNRDLDAAVKAGTFREDLYYRLNVVSLTMPPLRERREDIPLLASYFAAKYSKECKRRVTGISAEARHLLIDYDWPGNVRQLENAIERAVVMGSTELIVPEDLPEALLESQAPAADASGKYHEAIREAKRHLISQTLQQTNGNFTEAAKLLGIHPNNLHRLVRNFNLRGK